MDQAEVDVRPWRDDPYSAALSTIMGALDKALDADHIGKMSENEANVLLQTRLLIINADPAAQTMARTRAGRY